MRQPNSWRAGPSRPEFAEGSSGRGSRLIFAGAFVLAAAAMVVYGQFVPDPAETHWNRHVDALLEGRQLHIAPAELFDLMHNNQAELAVFDARGEADYNLFHLARSRRLTGAPGEIARIARLPATAVKVVVSNDEARAEAVARELLRHHIPGVYVLAGGLNAWIAVYAGPDTPPAGPAGNDELRFAFDRALGDRWPAADPHPHHAPKLAFTPKVKLAQPAAKPAGGCGA